MLKIHNLVKGERHPNATQLATTREVTTKTIYRDIAFMRDRMELPVLFESAYNGYCYDGDVGPFPTVQISEGELFAMLVAEKALQQYRGTSFEKPLVSAFRKVADSLLSTIKAHHFSQRFNIGNVSIFVVDHQCHMGTQIP